MSFLKIVTLTYHIYEIMTIAAWMYLLNWPRHRSTQVLLFRIKKEYIASILVHFYRQLVRAAILHILRLYEIVIKCSVVCDCFCKLFDMKVLSVMVFFL